MVALLKRLWRPLLGLVFVLTMASNYVVLPLLGRSPIDLPDGYWQVHLLVLPVLVAGRSWEKVRGKAE